jgi:NAD-dependent dihydropyrimidine dehydrogenase PreA subunit
MPPIIDGDKCEFCATCVEVCPEDVFYGSKLKETPQVAYPDECEDVKELVETVISDS